MQGFVRSTLCLLILMALPVLAGQTAKTTATRTLATQKQNDAQQKLATTRDRMRMLAEEQQHLADQRGAATQVLQAIDRSVATAHGALQQRDRELAAKQLQLDQLQQQKLTMENGLTRQRAELAALVRSAYALGRDATIKLLLEQDRPADVARVMAYHGYFQRDRQQRLLSLNSALMQLSTLVTSINAQQQALLAVRQQQQQELLQLSHQRQQREQVALTLDARYRDHKARLEALGRDEKQTVALLERLRKATTVKPPDTAGVGHDAAMAMGNMRLPIIGKVLAGYGGAMPDGHRSQGLLIAGVAGAPVHAVTAGRVAFADWLKGYGLLLILDHGKGWMTLYAFNDALLKKTGDAVQADDAIATVGRSGGQDQTALYFELRHNGQPEDPRRWLQKK